MRILFYTPFSSRSRDTETLMEAFIGQGHDVFLITQTPWGVYQEKCQKLGVKIETHVIRKRTSFDYFLRHTYHLIRFCRKNKIDVVYAHLENAGLPAVLSQYFIKSKVIVCRHVIDEAFHLESWKYLLLNKIVYRLARKTIVVSDRCKDWMIKKEGISGDKIQLINLAYNFNFYAKPDPEFIAGLKQKYPCKLLLLTACRQIKAKRTEISIDLVKRLRKEGFDVKLMVLGGGPNLQGIKDYVKQNLLEDCVFVLGQQVNIMDYLSACDVLVHPSITDSSSVIIKEAGLNYKTVLACSGIGDVDDYLHDGVDAYLVSKNNTENEMFQKLKTLYQNPQLLSQAGHALHGVVTERFHVSKMLPEYDKIHAALLNQ